MKIISVLDTTISDYNMGNQIIMDAIYDNLYDMFPEAFFYKHPYMEITKHTLDYIRQADFVFFGGTNSLCPEMEKYTQWGIDLKNAKYFKKLVLMGIGWWQYSNKTSGYSQKLYKKLLDNCFLHSVRDEYSKNKLNSMGYTNIINTGCPTLWNIDNSRIESAKSNKVICTLTDYNKDEIRDKKIIEMAYKNYDKVFYWLQGVGDYSYIKSLDISVKDENFIPPRIGCYNDFLERNSVDYLGTRLHGGIRALQKGKRTFIVIVDNRAQEMKIDFDLPAFSIDDLNDIIKNDYKFNIQIPHDNINKWKMQFN
ncbi:MAG: polysaccharide pyruvyl transferase family protein [Candidatus Gastranaerophilaceae bacterium]